VTYFNTGKQKSIKKSKFT